MVAAARGFVYRGDVALRGLRAAARRAFFSVWYIFFDSAGAARCYVWAAGGALVWLAAARGRGAAGGFSWGRVLWPGLHLIGTLLFYQLMTITWVKYFQPYSLGDAY